MRKHSSARCIAIAMFVLIFLSTLTCIADQRNLTTQELKAILDSDQKTLLINPLSDIELNLISSSYTKRSPWTKRWSL